MPATEKKADADAPKGADVEKNADAPKDGADVENADAPKNAPAEKEAPKESLRARIARIVREELSDGVTADADAIYELTRDGKTLARTARRKEEASRSATRLVAEKIAALRLSILLRDGTPDIAGASRTYKAAAHEIYAEYRLEGEDELQAFQRLNRQLQRVLPESVAISVAEGANVSVSDAVLIVKDAEKALASEDPGTVALIAAVDAAFKAGTDRPKNAPRSPFEKQREKAPRNTPAEKNDSEKEAIEKADTLGILAASFADSTLTLDVLLPELVRVLQAVDTRLKKRTPHYGDGGPTEAQKCLDASAAILVAVATRRGGGTITPEQDAAYRAALLLTFEQ